MALSANRSTMMTKARTRDTLAIEVGEEIDVVEVCAEQSISLGSGPTTGSTRTLEKQRANVPDALSRVGLRDRGTRRRRVDGVVLRLEDLLRRHAGGLEREEDGQSGGEGWKRLDEGCANGIEGICTRRPWPLSMARRPRPDPAEQANMSADHERSGYSV